MEEPICSVVGAIAKGAISTDYTEENIFISNYPLPAAPTCSKRCDVFEQAWGIFMMTDYCNPLPKSILSVGGFSTDNKSDLTICLESKLPHGDENEVNRGFKKVLVFAAQKSKQKNRKLLRKSKQYLTA